MLTIRKAQADALSKGLGQLILPCPENRTWVEIAVVDLDENPVPGVNYEVTLPDGSIVTGCTNQQGMARWDQIMAGECKISFPDYDRDAWTPK